MAVTEISDGDWLETLELWVRAEGVKRLYPWIK